MALNGSLDVIFPDDVTPSSKCELPSVVTFGVHSGMKPRVPEPEIVPPVELICTFPPLVLVSVMPAPATRFSVLCEALFVPLVWIITEEPQLPTVHAPPLPTAHSPLTGAKAAGAFVSLERISPPEVGQVMPLPNPQFAIEVQGVHCPSEAFHP